MTRINLIDPPALTSRHLVAEYKETTQFLHCVRKRVERNHPMDDIPKNYTLNTGHCKFFFDKGKYIHDRYVSLYRDMVSRGINPSSVKFEQNVKRIRESYSSELFNDYTPTKRDISIVVQRIKERILEKPHLYPDRNRFFDQYC